MTYAADENGIVVKKPITKATLVDFAVATWEKRRTSQRTNSSTQRSSSPRFPNSNGVVVIVEPVIVPGTTWDDRALLRYGASLRF